MSENHSKSDLINFKKEWTQSLEMHGFETLNIDANSLVEFKKKYNLKLKEIEGFVTVMDDWLKDAIEKFPEDDKRTKKRMSSQKLE